MAADTCKYCRVKIIFPVSTTGKRMPPVDAGPDPVGTVGVVQEVTGTHRGRFLAARDVLAPTEHRHAPHHCEGMERQRQRGNWKSAQAQHAAQKRRRRGRPAASPALPGMTRLYPGRDT